jgi:ferric-dicitrate binding protein FerR (iron transport regulator)
MAYKNPEDKRRWEREHREQRNAQRRTPRLGAQMEPFVPRSAPDPFPAKEPESSRMVVAGIGAFVLAVVIVLLAAWGGMGASGFPSTRVTRDGINYIGTFYAP